MVTSGRFDSLSEFRHRSRSSSSRTVQGNHYGDSLESTEVNLKPGSDPGKKGWYSDAQLREGI